MMWVVLHQQFLLATTGHLEAALRILGAVYASLQVPPNRLPVPFRQRVERQMQLAEDAPGIDLIARAWKEAQAMNWRETIAYAQHAGAIAAGESVAAG